MKTSHFAKATSDKQKGSVAIIVLIILLIAGGGYWYLNDISTDKLTTEVITQEVEDNNQQQETVWCTSTNPSKCFKYKCNTGFIENIEVPAPGSIPFKCSDGSKIEEVK